MNFPGCQYSCFKLFVTETEIITKELPVYLCRYIEIKLTRENENRLLPVWKDEPKPSVINKDTMGLQLYIHFV